MASAAALALLSGCGAGIAGGKTKKNLSSPAKLSMLSPKNGDVVKTTTLHVDLNLTGALVSPLSNGTPSTTEGHIRIYVNGMQVFPKPGCTTADVNVAAGMVYEIYAEFVQPNNQPYSPDVFTPTVRISTADKLTFLSAPLPSNCH